VLREHVQHHLLARNYIFKKINACDIIDLIYVDVKQDGPVLIVVHVNILVIIILERLHDMIV